MLTVPDEECISRPCPVCSAQPGVHCGFVRGIGPAVHERRLTPVGKHACPMGPSQFTQAAHVDGLTGKPCPGCSPKEYAENGGARHRSVPPLIPAGPLCQGCGVRTVVAASDSGLLGALCLPCYYNL